jgi:hypothetical protein
MGIAKDLDGASRDFKSAATLLIGAESRLRKGAVTACEILPADTVFQIGRALGIIETSKVWLLGFAAALDEASKNAAGEESDGAIT